MTIEDLGTDMLLYQRSAGRNAMYEIAPVGKDGRPDWRREFATTVDDDEDTAKLICWSVDAIRGAAVKLDMSPLQLAEQLSDGSLGDLLLDDEDQPQVPTEAERLLRLVCRNLCGTPEEEQSDELADIALAIEAHAQDLSRDPA